MSITEYVPGTRLADQGMPSPTAAASTDGSAGVPGTRSPARSSAGSGDR